MTKLYAQPYDTSAKGFYFESLEQFQARSKLLRNAYGDPVEEFELQFIDGEAINCALAEAWGINQTNVAAFLQAVEDWDSHAKRLFVIAVCEIGCSSDPETVDPEVFEIDIYHERNMVALAEEFVAEGLFGEIPEQLQHYIDYEAIARDLAVEYCETTIAGEHIIYRAA